MHQEGEREGEAERDTDGQTDRESCFITVKFCDSIRVYVFIWLMSAL